MESLEYFLVTYRRLIGIVAAGVLIILAVAFWAAHRAPASDVIVAPPATSTTLPAGVTTTTLSPGPLPPGEIDPTQEGGRTLSVDIGHQINITSSVPTGLTLTSSNDKVVLAGLQFPKGAPSHWVLIGLRPGVATVTVRWPQATPVVFRVRAVAVAPPITTPSLSHRSVDPFAQSGQTIDVPVNTDVTLTGLPSDLHTVAVLLQPTQGILYSDQRGAAGRLVPVVQVFSPGLYQVTVREGTRQTTVMLKAARP